MSLVRALAKAVAEDLFVNGAGEAADRLVLVDGTRDLGGWSRRAIADRVEQQLEASDVVALARDHCSQCGQSFNATACGSAHAMLMSLRQQLCRER